MTVTSPEGADFVAGLGVDRVVVGRELSVREIAKVSRGVVGGAVLVRRRDWVGQFWHNNQVRVAGDREIAKVRRGVVDGAVPTLQSKMSCGGQGVEC